MGFENDVRGGEVEERVVRVMDVRVGVVLLVGVDVERVGVGGKRAEGGERA